MEQAAKPFYDFMYGKFLLKEDFDIIMHEHDYIERAYNVWRDIGNIATCTHAFEFVVDSAGEVALPCNVEFVEAVSYGQAFKDLWGDKVTVWSTDYKVEPNTFLADSIVTPRYNRINIDEQQSNLHAKGDFIPYELAGQPGGYKLLFNHDLVGERGTCIYRGILVDDDGNPLLTRKEAYAIAYKLAFITTQKKAFMGDQTAMNLLAYIKPESGRMMAAAKIPEYMTQNELNRVLSTLTRHDRKVFWSSYKLLQ